MIRLDAFTLTLAVLALFLIGAITGYGIGSRMSVEQYSTGYLAGSQAAWRDAAVSIDQRRVSQRDYRIAERP